MPDLRPFGVTWVAIFLAAAGGGLLLGRYGWNVVALGFLYAALATSWSWMRASGLFSLGQAAFFGSGALAEGWLTTAIQTPAWLALPLAAAAGALIAVPLIPALRLEPANFALATLAYAVLLKGLSGNVPAIGPQGFLLPALQGPASAAVVLPATLAALAFGVGLGYHVFLGRRTGRVVAATRQAPDAAEASGIDLIEARVGPFVGNAAATALAGALYAHLVGSVEPVVVFAPILSALPLVLGLLGGSLNPLGGLVGTVALYPIDELLLRPALPQAHTLLYGVALVALLMLRPAGLLRAWVPVVPAGGGLQPRQPLALAAEHLVVRRNGTTVLSDVSLKVAPGEVLRVVGPNGAGKSTLLLALAGGASLLRGVVRLNGAPALRGVSKRARQGLARTFQTPQPFPEWTVRENVAIAAERAGSPGAVERVLDSLELRALERRPAGRLSVGEGKRLELARALAQQPTVLLLDEPLAGLSPETAKRVSEVIGRARDDGAAIIWVEHGYHSGQMADQLLVLEEGRVRFSGDPREWEAIRRSPSA